MGISERTCWCPLISTMSSGDFYAVCEWILCPMVYGWISAVQAVAAGIPPLSQRKQRCRLFRPRSSPIDYLTACQDVLQIWHPWIPCGYGSGLHGICIHCRALSNGSSIVTTCRGTRSPTSPDSHLYRACFAK